MAKDRRWLRLHVYGAMVVFQLYVGFSFSNSYDYGYEKRRRNHSRDRSATPDRHVHRHHRDSDSYSPHRNSYHSRHRHHKRRRHRRSYRHHHKSTYSSASSRVGVASGSVHVVIPARSFLRGVMGARDSWPRLQGLLDIKWRKVISCWEFWVKQDGRCINCHVFFNQNFIT